MTKTYLQFLNERLNPNFKGFVINHLPVKFTSHSLSRHHERTGSLSESDWKIFLFRVVDDIPGKAEGYYLYFSKSYNQGVVLYWNLRQIFIVTILPKGNRFAKSDTRLAIVEAIKTDKLPKLGGNSNIMVVDLL